jgi:hypothetical protein
LNIGSIHCVKQLHLHWNGTEAEHLEDCIRRTLLLRTGIEINHMAVIERKGAGSPVLFSKMKERRIQNHWQLHTTTLFHTIHVTSSLRLHRNRTYHPNPIHRVIHPILITSRKYSLHHPHPITRRSAHSQAPTAKTDLPQQACSGT